MSEPHRDVLEGDSAAFHDGMQKSIDSMSRLRRAIVQASSLPIGYVANTVKSSQFAQLGGEVVTITSLAASQITEKQPTAIFTGACGRR